MKAEEKGNGRGRGNGEISKVEIGVWRDEKYYQVKPEMKICITEDRDAAESKEYS